MEEDNKSKTREANLLKELDQKGDWKKKPEIKKAKKKNKIALSLFTVLGIVIGLSLLAKRAILWTDYNKVVFHKVVENKQTELGFAVHFNKPFTVEKRKEVIAVGITDDKFLANEVTNTNLLELANSTKDPAIAMKILTTFGEDGETMLATFISESGLKYNAINYNCIYTENGKQVSRSCNESDKDKAWSVDCGIAQLNFSGTACPEKAFNPLWNIDSAKAKYDVQGKNAWVAYWNGAYKDHLEN